MEARTVREKEGIRDIVIAIIRFVMPLPRAAQMEMASSVLGMDMNTSQMRMMMLSETFPLTAASAPRVPPTTRLPSMAMRPTVSEMRAP